MAGLLSRAQFLPCLLTPYELEVRDVSTNEKWAALYAFEVPVLAAETDGKQASCKRLEGMGGAGASRAVVAKA